MWPSPTPLAGDFVASARAIGIKEVEDHNTGDLGGVGPVQVTQRRGRRWSAADAFLAPARRRANLTVRTGAQVRRIRCQGSRATGVELGDGSTIDAGRVVVAAGAGLTVAKSVPRRATSSS